MTRRPKPRHMPRPAISRGPPPQNAKPAQPAKPNEGKTLTTIGQPALLWLCEQAHGGCGQMGMLPGLDKVKHWAGGGHGIVTCACGMQVDVGKPEPPRIVTPQQHAKQMAEAGVPMRAVQVKGP